MTDTLNTAAAAETLEATLGDSFLDTMFAADEAPHSDATGDGETTQTGGAAAEGTDAAQGAATGATEGGTAAGGAAEGGEGAGEATVTGGAGQEGVVTGLAKAIADEITARQTPTQPAAAADETLDILAGQELIEPGQEGYEAQQLQIVQFQRINDNVNVSERFARMGADAAIVDDVKTWAMARFEVDPAFAQRIIFDQDPFGAAIAEYKTAQGVTSAAAATDPEYQEFLAFKKAKADAEALGAGGSTTTPANGSTGAQPGGKPAAQPKKTDTPPQSIAGAPAAKGGGLQVPMGAGSAFDGTFAA